MRSQLKKLTSVILCVCMLMSILAITSVAEGTTATISFADKANRTDYSADLQIWVQNGITVTNEKGESTSNVGDYAKPGRFYKSSTFKIEYPGMTKIEIDCTGMDSKYVKAWTDSFEGATESDGIVTVEFAEAVDSASVKMAAQGRANSITVYAAAGSEGGEEDEVEGIELLVSHHNLYNWGTFESMIITGAGKTVKDVINQTPYWWIMYVVENVDGEYVATKYYKECDEINTTVAPEGGFLYYVYSANSDWAKVDEGALLGYTFKLVDFNLDASFAIDTQVDPSAVKHMVAVAPVVVDDESFKDTYTHVDGVNVGTIQQLGDEWADKLTLDFWYLVEDGATTVTVNYAVDNKVALDDDTMFRVWVDADLTDTARTTLYDYKVSAGEAYNAKHASSINEAIVSAEYTVVGNDYFFTLVLDKATLGINGKYSLNLQLGQSNSTTMHSIKYDNVTGAGATYAPWTTTEFYEVFGGNTLTIEEAIALGESKEHNTYTSEKYFVTGVITSVYNTQYGNMYIEDENGNRLTIYGTYSADGSLRYDAMEVKPEKGDTVTIYGIVGQYSGTAQVKNGWIVNHVPGEGEEEEVVPDPEADSTLTIEQAIALGASKDHNNYTSNKYYVTGVITEVYNEQYGNMKITDDNGNILTIYGTYSADGSLRYDAMEVKPVVGDTVTVYGIIGQYNDVAQLKNGWITAHTPAVDDEVSEEVSEEVSDEGSEEVTPGLGDSGFAVEIAIVMVIALAAVAVIYRNKRRA
ncbi:MAG: hypothetical protein J6V84_03290 [Clostridia bacterium]|nr:hypothetical protein [Clostridia bacterium]